MTSPPFFPVLFHQRCQGDGAVYAGRGVEAVPGVAKLGGHQAAKAVGGGVAAEAVGIGEKVALERGGVGVKILDQGGVPGGGYESAGGEEAKLLRGGGDVE